jgi:UDP-N-acetylmuramoylalanine--D-glutamate ligase
MGKIVSILGAGRSGNAAARLAECLCLDFKIISDDDTVAFNENFKDSKFIIVSPGIPPQSPLYKEACESGLEIISELEFAARNFTGKYLAITGTNGKTTTTELTAHLLNALKINTATAGNIGYPFSDICVDLLSGKIKDDIIPVIEVSSFQLERTRDFAPFAAAILNVAEDHLDRYPGGIEEYRLTKERIFNKVPKENRILGTSLKKEKESDSFTIEDGVIKYGEIGLVEYDTLQLKGYHNLENILAALELVSRVACIDNGKLKVIEQALKQYSPGKHRLEKVFESGEIAYINDSKGTNPAAVIAAVKSICGTGRNIRLILGGLDKGMDFTPLKGCSNRIAKAYITGDCRKKLYDTLNDSFECEEFSDFADCVIKAKNEAERGETVLLSPGCASWDMFKNYKERGERFTEIIKSGKN